MKFLAVHKSTKVITRAMKAISKIFSNDKHLTSMEIKKERKILYRTRESLNLSIGIRTILPLDKLFLSRTQKIIRKSLLIIMMKTNF
jgi:hypothetical protein